MQKTDLYHEWTQKDTNKVKMNGQTKLFSWLDFKACAG